MSTKRKRVVLTIEDKLNILEQLERGVSGAILSRQYGVGTSTISDIKKQSQAIKDYASKLDSQDGSSKRKTMKLAENQELESAMYAWFIHMRSQGQPINGPIICEKALIMNKLLNGDDAFKATTGWLQRFKSRHGIRELDIQGEKLSADVPAAERFKTFLKSFAKMEGLNHKTFIMRMKLVFIGKRCQPSHSCQKGKRQRLDTKPANPALQPWFAVTPQVITGTLCS